jgi:hypothetical protein
LRYELKIGLSSKFNISSNTPSTDPLLHAVEDKEKFEVTVIRNKCVMNLKFSAEAARQNKHNNNKGLEVLFVSRALYSNAY